MLRSSCSTRILNLKRMTQETGQKGKYLGLLLTATHSFKSSPSGNMTAIRRFPLPSVASACFNSSYWWEPSGIFFLGLNVLEERFPLWVTFQRGRQMRQTWWATMTSWKHWVSHVCKKKKLKILSQIKSKDENSWGLGL